MRDVIELIKENVLASILYMMSVLISSLGFLLL